MAASRPAIPAVRRCWHSPLLHPLPSSILWSASYPPTPGHRPSGPSSPARSISSAELPDSALFGAAAAPRPNPSRPAAPSPATSVAFPGGSLICSLRASAVEFQLRPPGACYSKGGAEWGWFLRARLSFLWWLLQPALSCPRLRLRRLLWKSPAQLAHAGRVVATPEGAVPFLKALPWPLYRAP